MVGLAAGRAAAALTLSRLLQPFGSIAQQSTLAQSVTQAAAPEATAAPPATALRSFYKRQLPRDLVAFSSAEARDFSACAVRRLRGVSRPQPYARAAAQGKRIFRAALDDGSLEGFFPLVQHFQTQGEPASCALGTLCMARRRVWRERRQRPADAPRRLRRC